MPRGISKHKSSHMMISEQSYSVSMDDRLMRENLTGTHVIRRFLDSFLAFHLGSSYHYSCARLLIPVHEFL